VLLLCIGSLSRWQWPDIEGLKEFGGTLVHSAQWDVGDGAWEEGVKTWGDKTVGIIGNVCTLSPFMRSRTDHDHISGVVRDSDRLGHTSQSQANGELCPWKNLD
jgi:hypothetical protein